MFEYCCRHLTVNSIYSTIATCTCLQRMSTLWCPLENDSCFRAVSNAWTLPSLRNMTECHGPILRSLLNSSNDATLTKGTQAACRYVLSRLHAHFLSNFMLVSCNAVTFMGQLQGYSTILSATLISIHQTSNIIVLQYALLSSSNSLQPSGHYMYHNSTTLRSAHTVYLCVLYGSENKQRLFLYTALTGWLLQPRFNPLNPSGQYMYHHI